MPNYTNSIIYKLCCKDTSITDIYVGSTTNKTKRKQKHKFNCNNETCREYNYYVYQFIRENGGWENWQIIVIENYPCQNRTELETRERYWLDELKATLNKQVPTRTQQEWYGVNRDRIKIYKKEWREANRDKISEKQKEYYTVNRDIILENVKQYSKENHDKILKFQKEYREANRDKINEKQKEKIVCECGCEINKTSLYRHRKSQKHMDCLNN